MTCYAKKGDSHDRTDEFSLGDTAFLAKSNRFARVVKIIRMGGFFTVRFSDGNGGIKERSA